MDWNAAIERNREALKRILAALIAMAGGDNRGNTLPRCLHRAVLRLLRPAETAARRLVMVAARGLVVVLPQRRPPPRPCKPAPAAPIGRNGAGILASPGPKKSRNVSLALLDPLRGPRPRRTVSAGVPRICVPGFGAPFPVAPRRLPLPGDAVNAVRLGLRLQALGRALDDLPAHARRFARWRARREAGRVRRVWPLRPGRPPGGPQRPTHEVHDLLAIVHGLALWSLERVDTS